MSTGGVQPRAELEQRGGGLLEGWKAIADYLGKTERTVQRWEKTKGLPVRRLRADCEEELPRVYAYRSELDAWWAQLTEREDKTDPAMPSPEPASGFEGKSHQDRRRLLAWRQILFWAIAGIVCASLGLATWRKYQLRHAPGRKVVLAVRPFQNLSGDPAQDYIGAALSEELVSRLGRLHPQRLVVIRLRGAYANESLERLGKGLRAAYVLEGSALRAGDQVAITAQLIQIDNQSITWGQSYTGDVKDLLRIQNDVAATIASEVLDKLPHDAPPAREVNREAYLDYLEGRYFWNKRTPDGFAKAITLFHKSIQIDPNYAPPYAGLADCYQLLGSAPYTALPPQEAFPKAEKAAKNALQLDETLAEAHVSLGTSQLVYERNLPEAKKELLRALELRPDYATGHQFYAYYLTSVGSLDEAIRERQKAVELDPLSPLLASALGEAYYQARQFDGSIAQNERALELDPSFAIALVNIGRAYQLKGMHQQARATFQKILALSPDEPAVLALLGHVYASSGDAAQAEKIIVKLEEISRHRYVPSLYIALVYTGMGDKEQAFQWLDKAYAERSEYLVYLPTEPLADPLRGDPRFDQLLKRLGLAPVKIPQAALEISSEKLAPVTAKLGHVPP
ncbi:MAG TPA: tetratricopeptide repeat protein [Terriglobales bacterium]|nr:tetratricopeptide repeat protein [Terriglobales bacterium]